MVEVNQNNSIENNHTVLNALILGVLISSVCGGLFIILDAVRINYPLGIWYILYEYILLVLLILVVISITILPMYIGYVEIKKIGGGIVQSLVDGLTSGLVIGITWSIVYYIDDAVEMKLIPQAEVLAPISFFIIPWIIIASVAGSIFGVVGAIIAKTLRPSK